MSASEPRDFELLDSVERIACIANEHRLAILAQLVAEPRTGAQVAQALELKAPLVHYHLQRLVEQGLAHEVAVSDERKGRSSERYFRAHASHLFVDPSLACRDAATARALAESFEQVMNAWQRCSVHGVDLDALAKRIVVEALGIEAGERLLIVSQPQVREIVDHLFLEAEALGALPALRPWSREYILARLARFESEDLAARALAQPEEIEGVAAVVLVSTTQPAGKPPEEPLRSRLPRLLAAVTNWQRQLRARGIRYLELSVPARGDLEHGQLPVEEAMATFWRALGESPDALAARIDPLVDAVRAASRAGRTELLLTDAVGSSVRLAVDSEHPHRNVGRVLRSDAAAGRLVEEFPPGSVAWFPVEGSGDGTLRMPYVAVGGARYTDVDVHLEGGRIVGFDGVDSESLAQRLASATGEADRISELRVGVNPAGDRSCGKASLDGVLAGTVTLAFGSNEILGGTRSATLDLRFPNRELTLATADGRELVRAGRLFADGAPSA